MSASTVTGARPRDVTAGSLYRSLAAASDMVLLNLVWLLASLPVVTFVPATAALFSVLRDRRLGSEVTPVVAFARALRTDLRRRTLLGLGWLAVAGVLAVDVVIVQQMGAGASMVLGVITGALALLFAGASTVLFLVIVSYDLPWRGLLRTTATLTLAMPVHVAGALLTLVTALAVTAVSPLAGALVAGSGAAWAIDRIVARGLRARGAPS
ncbi:DUF624 domain-containing protein [Ruania alkalisoli]|uniref:DUF624 domain-containing protein n=1 Tax=Ruania alkalisoli TaxID=2779775 RepID=A0A7M1SVW2_9MICO|nr:DUF624 domain-containing protein [Ruania alkalisoli]QOR71104.1 DUF624 domain-containing protein [Ruania alkalisoli]